MSKRHDSKRSGFSAFYAIALPMFVLGVTTNPAFLAVAFIFFIMAISEERDQQDRDQ